MGERAQDLFAEQAASEASVGETTKSPAFDDAMLPDRYPQQDLFICDVADAVLKDLHPMMEHPFYSLSKKPETAVRRYEHKGEWLEVTPSVKGMATIYDADILIYAISQIMAKLNNGEPVSKRVRILSHDCLKFTNRGTAGPNYDALCAAIDRLAGTRISTNIRQAADASDPDQTDDQVHINFGLIEKGTVVRKFGNKGRLRWVEVELSDWVFDAIRARSVLTLHRDYFRLRKPIERRIYQIARKHCGQKTSWSMSIALLFKKSGAKPSLKEGKPSSDALREFRRTIRTLAETDHLPDYRVHYDQDNDTVIFLNRETMPKLRVVDSTPAAGQFDAWVYDKARSVAPGFDVYALEAEWRGWRSGEEMRPEAAFIGFCRSKAKSRRG